MAALGIRPTWAILKLSLTGLQLADLGDLGPMLNSHWKCIVVYSAFCGRTQEFYLVGKMWREKKKKTGRRH